VRFAVIITEGAERDVVDIYDYIRERDSASNAQRVLDGLEKVCRGLSTLPERGNVPKELRAVDIDAFREVHSGPYRIIYRILGRRVLDGRRDMESLLRRRLLR
jgi:toxin ParE1/3/4